MVKLSRKDKALARLITQAKMTDEYQHPGTLRRAVAAAEEALHDAGNAAEQLLDACHEAEVAFVVCNICDGLTPQARGAIKTAWAKVSAAMAVAEGTVDEFKEANPELA